MKYFTMKKTIAFAKNFKTFVFIILAKRDVTQYLCDECS